jgi:hypothetical protein
MNAKTYLLPGTDAAVVVATDKIHGIHGSLTLLAKGTSRHKDGTHSARNSERKDLWEHLVVQLCLPWNDRVADVAATRGGRADTPAVRHDGRATESELRQAYSRAGNYKLDLELVLHRPMSDDELADGLGLVEREGARRLPSHRLWSASP